MTTRTLGVKFEVAGYQRAADSMRLLQERLDESLGLNTKVEKRSLEAKKQQVQYAQNVVRANSKIESSTKKVLRAEADGSAARTTVSNSGTEKLNIRVEAELKPTTRQPDVTDYGAAAKLIRQERYREAVQKYVVPRANTIQGGYFEGIGSEFGRRFAVSLDNRIRGLFGLKAYREEIDLSKDSADKIGLAVAVRLAKVFDKSFKIEANFNGDNKLDKQLKNLKIDNGGGFLSKAFNALTMPLRTIQYGFYEGIGSEFGRQYASGVTTVLDEDLDFSMERRGQVGGKAIAYLGTEGFDQFFDNVRSLSDRYLEIQQELDRSASTEGLQKIKDLLPELLRTLIDIPAKTVTAYKRGSVEIEGLRKFTQEIEQLDPESIPDLEGKDQVVFTMGGFAANKGKQGHVNADEIRKYADDGTAVFGADNTFTDLEFSVFGNKALWGGNLLAKIAQLNLKGFNPDAVKQAAQIAAIRQKYPDIQIRLVGHSAGGFVAEEVQHLLNLLEVQGVETIASGTPRTVGGLNIKETRQVVGDGDDIIQGAEQVGQALGLTDERNPEDTIKGVDSHYSGDYLSSFDYINTVLGGRAVKTPEMIAAEKKAAEAAKTSIFKLSTLHVQYLAAMASQFDELKAPLEQGIDLVRPDRIVSRIREQKLTDKTPELVEAARREKDYKPTKVKEGTETVVLTIGGFGGAEGRSGIYYARQLDQMHKKVGDGKTQFVGALNPFTDVYTKEELTDNSTEARINRIQKVVQMFAKVHEIGYNPDAIPIAAQVMDLLEQHPDLNVKVAGYSGGGFVAEDVMRILQQQGVNLNRVETMGVATPELPAGIKSENHSKIFGENDEILGVAAIKQLNKDIHDLVGFFPFPELAKDSQNVPGIDTHMLGDYIEKSPEVGEFLFGADFTALNQAFDEVNAIAEEVMRLREESFQAMTNPKLSLSQKTQKAGEIDQLIIERLKKALDLNEQALSRGGGRIFAQMRDSVRQELIAYGAIQPEPEPAPEPEPTAQGDKVEDDNNPRYALDAVDYTAAYSDYLQELIDRAAEDAQNVLFAAIPDFESLDINQRQDQANQIKDTVVAQIKTYRKALASGDLTLARELGERILAQIQLVKRAYRDIGEATDSQQLQNVVRGNQSYLTSLETEIRTGQPNMTRQGRAGVGLETLFTENLEQPGSEATAGFVQGILSDLDAAREAGAELGRAARKGTEDELDIQSPSRVFKQLGKFVVGGFAMGLEGFNALYQDVRDRAAELEQLGRTRVSDTRDNIRDGAADRIRGGIVGGARSVVDWVQEIEFEWFMNRESAQSSINEISDYATDQVQQLGEELRGEFATEIEDTAQAIDEAVTDAVGASPSADSIASFLDSLGVGALNRVGELLFEANNNPNSDRILTTLGSLAGKVLQFVATLNIMRTALDVLGLGKLVEGFTDLPNKALDAAMAVETLDRRILDMSANSIAGARNLAFIGQEARRLNVDLGAAKEGFAELVGSTRNTALEGFQTEQIFTAFASTAKAKGLTGEEQGRLFQAVRQMIGKRYLQAEEVRGQVGELLGDFEQTLAISLGMTTAELNDAMVNRKLVAEDVLPKVAAQLIAQNGLSSGADTAVEALTRLDNAILSFQQNFGAALQPIQKFGYKALAGFFNWLAERLDDVGKAVTALLVYLVGYFFGWGTVLQIVQKALIGLIKVIWSFRAAIGSFLVQFALFYAAWETIANVFKLMGNAFPDLRKDIDELTSRLAQLEAAFNGVSDAGQGMAKSMPQTGKELQLNEGWEIPDNWFGNNILKPLVGGDRLNLDNLFRKRFYKEGAKNIFGMNLYTQAEKREADFRVSVGDLSTIVDRTLGKEFEARTTAEEILKLDAEIREIQSARLSLLPGDKAGLEASLKAEQEVQRERSELLEKTAQFTTALTANIEAVERQLEQLTIMEANGEITEGAAEFSRRELERRLEDLNQTKEAYDDIVNSLNRSIGELDRRMRSLRESLAGFKEESDRTLATQRAEIINQGVEEGQSDQIIQLELDELTRRDLENRLRYLRGEISKVERDLASPEVAQALERLKKQATEQGSTLDSSATIERMLDEERSGDEQSALNAYALLRELNQEFVTTQESLAQSLQQSRFAVTDLVRSVDDFFFRLSQQIKQAFVEMQQIFNTLSFTRMRGELMRAIVPGSNNFFNSVIEAVQSVLDEAQQIAERAFEQQNNLINFEGERYDLNTSLNDFIRQIAGASEAVMKFRQALGDTSATYQVDLPVRTNQTSNNVSFKPYEVYTTGYLNGKIQTIPFEDKTLAHHTYQKDSWGFHVSDFTLIRNGSNAVPVPAAASGTVTASGFNNRAGNFVELTHADGHKSKYTHFSTLAVKKGDVVEVGQSLGIQGNTGRSSGPHVHFGSTDPNMLLEYLLGLERGSLRDRHSILNNQSVQPPHGNTMPAENYDPQPQDYPLSYQESRLKIQQYDPEKIGTTVQHLKEAGFTPAGISAAVGAFLQESALDPYAENKRLPVGQRPYGIAQWRLNRRTNMPAPTGNEFLDLKNQLDYFIEELKGKNNEGQNGKLFRILTSTSDLVEANKAMAAYERFHNYQNYGVGKEWGARIELSKIAFDQLKKLRTRGARLPRPRELSVQTSSPQTVNSSVGESPSVSSTITVSSDPTRGSTELTDILIKQREFNLEQQQRVLEVERGLFQDRTRAEQERLQRESLLNIEDTQRQLNQSGDQLEDLQISNSPPDIQQQVEQQQRNALRAFDDFEYELIKQLFDLEDRVRAAESFVAGAPSQIERLRAEGTPEAVTAADFIESQLKATQEYLPEYRRQLAQQRAIVDAIPSSREDAAQFQQEEAQLAVEADSIQKSLKQLQQQQEIAAVTSGLEAQKELELQKLQLEYAQKINQLQKEERGNPEYLDAMIQKERELLEIRSRAVEIDYQSRELEQRQAVQNLEQSIGGVESQKLESVGLTFEAAEIEQQNAVLAENLRYRQEILEIERKYAGQPELIWQMTAQAGRLNELNLENIDRQFKSLGETLEEQALSGITQVLEGFFSLELNLKSIILSIAKSFASLAAQNVAGGIARMIGLNFSGGGTIPNFKNGGRILPDGVSDTLRNNVPGIRDAFQREGNGGVLAVFKPGEEVLPLNGEAQRYQALKARLGKNPLRDVFAGNFKEGGTVDVGSMALGRIRDKNPSLIYSLPRGKMKDNNTVNRPVTVNATIVTPDADSYRASRYQIEREMAETYRRSLR